MASAYRNHRSSSDCYLLHGYARDIHVVFGAKNLDNEGFVVDFGGLKDFKRWLEEKFDHTTVLQADDPLVPAFRQMEKEGYLKLTVLPLVSCEGWAMYIAKALDNFIQNITNERAYVLRLEVKENSKNSAIYHNRNLQGEILEDIHIDDLDDLTREMEHGPDED